MSEELFAKYSRMGELSDKAGREYDRRFRAVEIAKAIGVQPMTVDALRVFSRQAERLFWRLCILRHAAFNAWNDVRKAEDAA